jgi:hypothetical protein
VRNADHDDHHVLAVSSAAVHAVGAFEGLAHVMQARTRDETLCDSRH